MKPTFEPHWTQSREALSLELKILKGTYMLNTTNKITMNLEQLLNSRINVTSFLQKAFTPVIQLPPTRTITPTFDTLYHATSVDNALAILNGNGILPRKELGTESRFKDFPSNPECVYMSYSHGAFFAGGIAGGKATLPGKRGERYGLANAIILEIDATMLDTALCLPDEDYLEQHGRYAGDGIPGSIYTRTAHYRDNLVNYADRWEECFRNVGSVAYRGTVPLGAIKRMTFINWEFFDPRVLMDMYHTYLESCVPAPALYPHFGATQRELTQLFFGDRKSVNGKRLRLNRFAIQTVKNKHYKNAKRGKA
jgi:hypothetical protein